MEKRERHALWAEYDKGFGKAATELRLRFDRAIETQDIAGLEAIGRNASDIPDLQPLLEGDIALLKLYSAAIAFSHAELAQRRGLPTDIAEHHKQTCFEEIVSCETAEALGEAHYSLAKRLILGLQKYSMRRYSPLVRRAVEYIHNNKFTFLYARDVAGAVHADRSHLGKLFRREVGRTLTDYIHGVKLDTAVELMETNLYRLNEIAELLGYADAAYFNRVFKKYMGAAPAAYLQKTREI